jgi:iron complex transport system permease protein
MIRHKARTALLVGLVPASFCFAMLSGSADIGVKEFGELIAGNATPLNETIFHLRAMRAVDGFTVGALLAMAGSLLQVLLRNPLAEPYILGISGGAGVASLSLLLLGISVIWLPAAAFGGALLSTLLVFSVGFSRGSWSPARLLLTGVVIAAGWSACISFLLALSTQRQVHGMLFWLMGDLGQSSGSWTGLVMMIGFLIICWLFARQFNMLAKGEMQAASLGVSVVMLRRYIFILASAMTAVSVSMAGSIGFVGLIVPHTLRLLGFGDYRALLPAAVAAGGSFLVITDTLARTILAPRQVPVGVVTALVGVPLFLFLLQRQYGIRKSRA